MVIQGARQVGNSTLASMLVAQRNARIVTLDDGDQREAAEADPGLFVGKFPQGTLVIDEVQRVPDLLLAIKANIDRHRQEGRFLLSGSADLLRVKGQSESLAGRAVTLRLRGLSQGELTGTREDWVSAILRENDPRNFDTSVRRNDYIQRIARGSFPVVQELPSRPRHSWLDSYIDRVLERDATILPSGGDGARLSVVISLLAAHQAGELVVSRIADQAKLPTNSVNNYIDVLKSVYLIDTLHPWGANLTNREIGKHKVMVSDSALALRLTKINPYQ